MHAEAAVRRAAVTRSVAGVVEKVSHGDTFSPCPGPSAASSGTGRALGIDRVVSRRPARVSRCARSSTPELRAVMTVSSGVDGQAGCAPGLKAAGEVCRVLESELLQRGCREA